MVTGRAIFQEMLQVIRGTLMATLERPVGLEVVAGQLVVGHA